MVAKGLLGYPGRYFRERNRASAKGLSSLTLGLRGAIRFRWPRAPSVRELARLAQHPADSMPA
jgi:hypothetical protein